MTVPLEMELELLADPRCLVVRGRGGMTPAWAHESMVRVLSHPASGPELDVVLDIRAMSTPRSTPADVRSIVVDERETAPYGPRRMAILVANDLQFGVARMFELLAETGDHREHRVVRSLEEAFEWFRQVPATIPVPSLPQ